MEQLTEEIERPSVGPHGEPCGECGTALARDQRYCLVCGARRAGLAAQFAADPAGRRPAAPARTVVTEPAAPAAVAVASERPWRLDAGLLTGVGVMLLSLLVGVLIGKSGGDSRQASTPQVVQLGATPVPTAAGAGSGRGSATAAFHSDWPAGKRGFTVQLQSLPKGSADAAAVAAAKQQATAKGAPAVGALDSDGYSSLPSGHYIVYSGTFADRRAAAKALGRLNGKFPGAKVVEVRSSSGGAQRASTSGGGGNAAQQAAVGKAKAPSAAQQAAGAKAIQDIQNASGQDYSKKSAKLPKTLVTPGTPPPVDNKPAGGGSSAETFK